MIVPKLIEGWEAKYITGSGQKDTTISRVKIFEHEGNVKPNTRTKQTWVTEQMPAPKAKHPSSKRNIKGDNSNLSRQSRPRGLRQSALRSYEEFANDMTDEDNESMSAVTMRSALIDQSVSLSMDVPPLLLRGSSMGQADEEYFLQALTLFRQGSGPVALARAHSLSLSRAVSSNSTLDLGEFRMPVIDFSITDSFAPSSPRWTFVDA